MLSVRQLGSLTWAFTFERSSSWLMSCSSWLLCRSIMVPVVCRSVVLMVLALAVLSFWLSP